MVDALGFDQAVGEFFAFHVDVDAATFLDVGIHVEPKLLTPLTEPGRSFVRSRRTVSGSNFEEYIAAPSRWLIPIWLDIGLDLKAV